MSMSMTKTTPRPTTTSGIDRDRGIAPPMTATAASVGSRGTRQPRPRARHLAALVAVAVAVVTTAAPGLATADDGPEALAGSDEWNHFEFEMGFLTGQRDYTGSNFTVDHGVPGLLEPFSGPPFDGVSVLGLHYDLRLVVNHVRMTSGLDIPFSDFRAADTTATYQVGDRPREVTVQSIRPWELRFGLGAEYPAGPVVPFADLIGSVHWVSSDLSVDGDEASYRARSFAMSARAGARIHVRRWFYASLAGEIGLVGAVDWGASLAVGFATL